MEIFIYKPLYPVKWLNINIMEEQKQTELEAYKMNCNKCVDILVGLNAGSEGKGGLVSILNNFVKYQALVRTGATNAAHSVEFNNKIYVYHQIPAGAMHFPYAKLVLGANAQIDIEYLKREIEVLKEANVWSDDRLMIDPNATIIDPIDKIAENGGRMPDCGDLYFHPRDCEVHQKQGETCFGCEKLPNDSAWAKLGSTTHGVGANICRKAARGTKMIVLPGQKFDFATYVRSKVGEEATSDEINEFVTELVNNGSITDWGEFIEPEPIRYAGDDKFLKQFLCDTVGFLNRFIDQSKSILLEGTQGSVLSLHHGYRNKCTSRDTNASNWCADAGISPFAVRDVYGVTRTFPIRVAGNSGPMSGEEITWEEITKFAESPEPIVEITTATKRKRRVFTLDRPGDRPSDLRKALNINRPTKLMLSFVDYLSYQDRHKSSWGSLTQRTKDWITTLESKFGIFFNYLSTGPDVKHTIFR